MITKASFWQFTRRIQQLSTDSQGLGKRTACLANPFRLRDRAYDAANSYRYNTYSHWRHRLLYRAVLAFEGRRITTDRSREKIWEEDCFWERKGDTKSGHSQNAFAAAACFVFPYLGARETLLWWLWKTFYSSWRRFNSSLRSFRFI